MQGTATTPEDARAALDGVDSAEWAARFALLSDPHRLHLLLCLHLAPDLTVSELAAAVGRHDSTVSHALGVLRAHGVVAATRDGQSVRYRLTDPVIHDVLHGIGADH